MKLTIPTPPGPVHAVDFTVDMDPVAKERPRFTVDKDDPVAKERPGTGKGRTYTPQKTKDAETKIAWAYRLAARGARPGTQPCAVTMHFHIRPYKNGNPRRLDIDNLEKTVLDALNGLAWVDDMQVDEVHKYTHRFSTEPRITVSIRPLPEETP